MAEGRNLRDELPLFNRGAVIAGVAAPFFCVLADAVTVVVRGPLSLLQDFFIFWAAARVLNQGGNPYANASLTAVLKPHGIDVLLGTGYSYPLLLAEVLRPLGALEPYLAGAVFVAVSSVGLGIAVALLAGSVRSLCWPWALLWGALAGLFPAVSFGMFEGQSNLLVLPFLALAYRGVGPGASIAVATSVKLYPVAGLVALAVRRRWREVATGVVAVVVLIIGPRLVGGRQAGGSGSLAKVGQLLAPDSYHTNMSINGFLSRAVLNPGWPLRAVPVALTDVVVVGLLGLAVLVLAWRRRDASWQGGLALLTWYATVSAPKNSLWNLVPLLLPLAYVLAAWRRHPWAVATAVTGFLLTAVQILQWAIYNPLGFRPEVAYLNLAVMLGSGTALWGAMLVGAACAAVLARERALRAPAGVGSAVERHSEPID